MIGNAEALRALFDRWAQAVRDENLEGIRADHDPDMLMFDVPPPFASRGIEEYMAHVADFLPVAREACDVRVSRRYNYGGVGRGVRDRDRPVR
jgi:ketosteroid isomerase-like protein